LRVLLALVLVTSLLPFASILHAQININDEVDRILRSNSLDTATISIVVKDLASDTILIDHDGEKMMIPASNMKLLTTGVTLLTLGPDFSFQTRTMRDEEDASFSSGRVIRVLRTPNSLKIWEYQLMIWRICGWMISSKQA